MGPAVLESLMCESAWDVWMWMKQAFKARAGRLFTGTYHCKDQTFLCNKQIQS